MIFPCDLSAARSGDVVALAKLGTEAFKERRVVEAIYWMVMADLRGFSNIRGIIDAYAASWLQMGCPEQKECVTEQFADEQRQFGFYALQWIAGKERLAAREWFAYEKELGNYDAEDFMTNFIFNGTTGGLPT